jgi:hypothetical protein
MKDNNFRSVSGALSLASPTALAIGALFCATQALADTTVFESGPYGSSSIVAAPATYGGGYLASDGGGTIYSIGADGGSPTFLANIPFRPFAGAILGSFYGTLSGQYLAVGGDSNTSAGGDAATISRTGAVTALISSSGAGQFSGAAVAPSAYGSIGAGQVLLTALNGGNIDALSANGKSVSTFATVPNIIEPSGIGFAPKSFGTDGGDLFVTDAQTETVYVVKPNGVASLFAGVPLPSPGFPISAGLLQLGFAPAGFGKYGGDLFVSGFGSMMGGTAYAAIVALNSSGQEVATFNAGTGANLPTGVYFAMVKGVPELLATTNGNEIEAISVTSTLPPPKAPELDASAAAGALTLLLGALAVLRGRRASAFGSTNRRFIGGA